MVRKGKEHPHLKKEEEEAEKEEKKGQTSLSSRRGKERAVAKVFNWCCGGSDRVWDQLIPERPIRGSHLQPSHRDFNVR